MSEEKIKQAMAFLGVKVLAPLDQEHVVGGMMTDHADHDDNNDHHHHHVPLMQAMM